MILISDECESARLADVSEKRENTPCRFVDGITYEDFSDIAYRVKKRIKRIINISISGAVIYCTVESQTGYSNWEFSVDFNNWGHVTGVYWRNSENADSAIPKHFGNLVSGEINQLLHDRGIDLTDFSDYVDWNNNLGTSSGLNFSQKQNFFKKAFFYEKQLVLNVSSQDLIGEHIYYVVSRLKCNSIKNVKTFSIADVCPNSNKYVFEVEQVVINGVSFFEAGFVFNENAQVYITYHAKKQISIPNVMSYFKNKNYVLVGDQLQSMGFTNIYERKLGDLVTGWITKVGSVEQILIVVDGDEIPYARNHLYDLDVEIIITYHSF